MKTYYEMTESVLERAKTEVLQQKRRRRNGIAIAATGLCMAMVLTVLGVGLNQNPAEVPTLPDDQLGIFEDATETSQPADQQVVVKVTYLSNIEGQVSQETVSADVSIPLNGMIWVRDTRELTEEERIEAVREETAIAEAFRLAERGSYTRWAYPGCVTSVVSNGFLTLDFSDFTAVKSINIETTDIGCIHKGSSPNGKGSRLVELDWSISSEFAYELHKDPTIPLESIRDTITITINYENGTTETLVFDITVNEEGQIFMTQRGIPTIAA